VGLGDPLGPYTPFCLVGPSRAFGAAGDFAGPWNCVDFAAFVLSLHQADLDASEGRCRTLSEEKEGLEADRATQVKCAYGP